MTEIKIYGFLSKIFGSSIKIHLGKLNDVINAIDSIKTGFKQKIIELNKNGMQYSVQRNGCIVNIMPAIQGSKGGFFRKVLGFVLIIGGVVAAAFGQFWLTSIAFGAAFALFAFKLPPAPSFKDTNVSTGGGVTAAGSGGKSSKFDRINQSSQGTIVNVGYGKFRTGSKSILQTIKNFSTDKQFSFEINPNQNLIDL